MAESVGKTSAGKLLLASDATGAQTVDAWSVPSVSGMEKWLDATDLNFLPIPGQAPWVSSQVLPSEGLLFIQDTRNAQLRSAIGVFNIADILAAARWSSGDLTGITHQSQLGGTPFRVAANSAGNLVLQAAQSALSAYDVNVLPSSSGGSATQLLAGVSLTFPSGATAGQFVLTTADVPTSGELIVKRGKLLQTFPAVALATLANAAAGDTPGDANSIEWGGGGGGGAVGPQGPEGPRGPPGPKGDTGDRGAEGARGATGPPGGPGPKGDKGDTGQQGLPGQQGATGPRGAKGDTGDVGRTGPPGADGQDGKNGVDGARGPQGLRGATGGVGPPGPKGDPGPMGATGATGTAGSDGAVGPRGDKGDPGPAGTAGEQGQRGPQGLQGAAGPKGDKGDPGRDGTDIPRATQAQVRAAESVAAYVAPADLEEYSTHQQLIDRSDLDAAIAAVPRGTSGGGGVVGVGGAVAPVGRDADYDGLTPVSSTFGAVEST